MGVKPSCNLQLEGKYGGKIKQRPNECSELATAAGDEGKPCASLVLDSRLCPVSRMLASWQSCACAVTAVQNSNSKWSQLASGEHEAMES